MSDRIALMIVIIGMGLLVSINMVWNYKLTDEIRINSHSLELMTQTLTKYDLYDPGNKQKVINGVYFSSKGYYCVKTEGRDWTDIKLTDSHEMCHWFVDMDYGHFCQDENQTNWDIEGVMRGKV